MNTEAIDWIIKTLSQESIFSDGSEWYLFGSTTKRRTSTQDIDILIIYTDPSKVETIRKKISSAELHRPLDLLFMTREEAIETNFIIGEKCIQIFPINSLEKSPE